MSEVKVNKISPRSGTDVTLGDASDTFTIPASATLDVNGTIDVTGATVTGLSLEDDIAILGFKVAANGSLAKYNLVDQTIDDFQDTSGVDASASTNEVRDSSGKYYKGETTATPTTTGGTLTTYTDGIEYKVRTFTDEAASDNFVTDIALTADILIVGGGGTGDFASASGGYGGGAGGFKYYSGYAVTAATHAIDVGDRGIASGGGSSPQRQDGHNSSFGSLIALKGNGADGGSGTDYGSQGAGSDSVTPTPNQGNAMSGQAGGGAAEAGGTDGSGHGGDGYTEGTSTVYDWTLADGTTALFKVNGTGNSYGGGGSGNGQAGGLGGGGSSSAGGGSGGSGSANTGGGGGGGDDGGGGLNRGGHGGTGIVVVRYPSSVTSEGANMTLASTTTTAQAAPTKGDIVFTYTNGAGSTTLGTDVTAEYSADGGSTWTAMTLGSEGSTGGHNIATAHDITLTSTSGTSMAYRIKTLNQSAAKTTRIQAVSLGWS